MPKINIVASLTTNNKTNKGIYTAIYTNNKLIYKEDEKTLVTFKYEPYELIRKKEDFNLHFYFTEKAFLSLELTSLNKKMTIPIKLESIIKTKNSITIKYFLEEELYIYKIEVKKWVF